MHPAQCAQAAEATGASTGVKATVTKLLSMRCARYNEFTKILGKYCVHDSALNGVSCKECFSHYRDAGVTDGCSIILCFHGRFHSSGSSECDPSQKAVSNESAKISSTCSFHGSVKYSCRGCCYLEKRFQFLSQLCHECGATLKTGRVCRKDATHKVDMYKE